VCITAGVETALVLCSCCRSDLLRGVSETCNLRRFPPDCLSWSTSSPGTTRSKEGPDVSEEAPCDEAQRELRVSHISEISRPSLPSPAGKIFPPNTEVPGASSGWAAEIVTHEGTLTCPASPKRSASRSRRAGPLAREGCRVSRSAVFRE
jgi:hypothetical protein